MWMRACALCKAVLFKFRLVEKVRCRCGWEWGWLAPKVEALSSSRSDLRHQHLTLIH
jgi:hypothetical protein